MKKSFIVLALLLAFSINAQIAISQSPNSGKWTFGGNIGLGPSDNGGFQFSIAPEVGYRTSDNLEIGCALGYNYFKNDFYKSNFFNAGPYVNYSIMQNLFLRAQYQYLFGNSKTEDGYTFNGLNNSQDISESALWLGGGYQNRIGDNVYYKIGVMYNVLYNEDDSIYGSAFLPIGGITFGF